MVRIGKEDKNAEEEVDDALLLIRLMDTYSKPAKVASTRTKSVLRFIVDPGLLVRLIDAACTMSCLSRIEWANECEYITLDSRLTQHPSRLSSSTLYEYSLLSRERIRELVRYGTT